MLEENEIRVNWQTDKFEEDGLRCSSCGDQNAWDGIHACCQEKFKKAQQCSAIAPASGVGPYQCRSVKPRDGESGQTVRDQV